MDEFGEIGVKSLSNIQSQIHSDYDSAESSVDSDPRRWTITENVGVTSVFFGCEKKTLILLENLLPLGNLTQWICR